MSEIAIHAEGLGKKYRIGTRTQSYRTLRDSVAEYFSQSFQRLSGLLRGPGEVEDKVDESIWALRDVNLEIKRGEVVGIIGGNGAGKSTLLKILSRITEPTIGFAEIQGRVASLLEVGTGFHQELTGRENIYLNGAILGMKRAEIVRNFDEIVAFAEVERFIDTPVKHYSSGMYLRLAFAVAAHLEPEILIVDEVLAVGDARFQKKCLDKMKDVNRHGRTVLFVSHNTSAVTRLCGRAILLDQGRVIADGPAHKVVSSYLNSGLETTGVRTWPNPERAPRGEVVRLRSVQVKTQDRSVIDVTDIREPVLIEMEYEVLRPGFVLSPYFEFLNEEGLEVFSSVDLDPVWRRRHRPTGHYISATCIPGNLLSEGTLIVNAGMATLDPIVQQFYEREVVAFLVVDSEEGDSARGDWTGPWGGAVRPLLQWTTQFTIKEQAVDLVSDTKNGNRNGS